MMPKPRRSRNTVKNANTTTRRAVGWEREAWWVKAPGTLDENERLAGEHETHVRKGALSLIDAALCQLFFMR